MRTKLNMETIVALSAIFTSITALFIAWDQAQVMRAQQHASVQPIVGMDFIADRDEDRQRIRFILENVGVGPALIRNGEITINGSTPKGVHELKKHLLIKPFLSQSSSLEIFASRLLGPLGAGKQRVMLGFQVPLSLEYSKVRRQIDYLSQQDIQVNICYCSVFDKCWRASLNSSHHFPQSVHRCEESTKDPIGSILE